MSVHAVAADYQSFVEMDAALRGDSPGETATKILNELGITGHAFKILFPPLVHMCAMRERGVTRDVERSVRIVPNVSGSTFVPVDRVADKEFREGVLNRLRPLLEQPFVYKKGNGSPRETSTWGQATVGIHRQRIVLLEQTLGGVRESIDMHRTAVQTLTEANCSCLNDYYRKGKRS